MASDFVVGKTYTNTGAGAYSDSISLAKNNVANANEPTETYICTKVSKVFATFTDQNTVLHRLRKYVDLGGIFVYTHNRFAGAPILRP